MWLFIGLLIIGICVLNKSQTTVSLPEPFRNLKKNYLKQPLPLSCLNNTHPTRQILDSNNEIVPTVTIESSYFAHPNLHPKKFTQIIGTFKLDSPVTGKFIELPTPETSYWKKYTETKIPMREFEMVLVDVKKRVDVLFQTIKINSTIISKSIVRILRNKDWYNFQYLFDYYHDGNIYAHRLYLESYISRTNATNMVRSRVKHSQLKLVGLISEDRFRLQQASNQESSSQLKIYTKFPEIPYRASSHYLRDDNYTDAMLSYKDTYAILKKKNTPKIGMICYDGMGELKKYCESKKDYLGKSSQKGTWDTPCQEDSECPFYRVNKNYPNKRGGCIQGKCEMPINVHRKGARFYDKTQLPYCYNCDINNPSCCKTQRQEFPNIKSPDYAFVNDIIERTKHRDSLEKKGLKIV